MITGVVNATLEARIKIEVRGASRQAQEVEAVIDTGFSGFLTLSPGLVASFGLLWLGREQGILADGSTEFFDVYEATIIWEGQPRIIQADVLDVDPLVGTALLQGHDLRIQMVDGGTITIAALP